MVLIFKLLDLTEWRAFEQNGVFAGSEVDRQDGFIHFSYAHQLGETAARYFRNRPDLVMFACDRGQFGAELKDEASRGGDLFPHLFAPLRRDQVLFMRAVPLGADGVPIIDLTSPE
jgi:uncharacterized protein (DUF952 family)